MDLLGYSNQNFRKCGEITTAIKVGKKVVALNCGFCSKIFIKLHAFTLHIGENHEKELFGYLEDGSCRELPVSERKEDILTKWVGIEDEAGTEEIKFVEIVKLDEESEIDFLDPLEASSVNETFKEIPNILDGNEEEETCIYKGSECNYQNYDDKNDTDFKLDPSETENSSESDEQDYHDEDDDSKELTLAIITAFEKHHILWDSSEPISKTRKERIEAHKLIATKINEQMGMTLKWNAIHARIKKLCSKFCSELQKLKNAKSRGKVYAPIWYFDKLSFLNENGDKLNTKKQDDLPDYEALVNSKKLTLAIIAEFKEHHILWDSSEPMAKTRKRRIEAHKMIASSVNEKMGMNLKWNVIRDQIKKLCSKFRSEVQKQKHAESRGRKYTPIWYYDKLSFLNANIKYKPKIKKQTQVNAKELTKAIIAGFEKHRVLWDTNDPGSKDRKQLIEAQRSIANSINKQMLTNLKWNHISDRIKKLCYKFRLELQNQKLAESKGEDYTPVWYYDKLLFLNTGTEYIGEKDEMKLKSESREYELPLPTLTDSKNLELIEIYKSFSCLWNMEHIEFRVTNRRQEAINEMIQEIRTKMDLNLTQDELQKKINYVRDAYSHESHRKIKCERLNKIFTPFYKFYEKISFLENNVSPFKCDICEETFDGFSRYKIHKSQHDGSMPFTCALCKHGFMDVSNYAVHMRRHTHDYPIECEVCKKRFAINDDIKRHMRCHTGEKPYFCEICGQSSRTSSSLNVHMRQHSKKTHNHNCIICSKSFYEKSRLKAHMNVHLNIREKVCNVCGKAFTDTHKLRQHQDIHAEKKKYVCRICGKDFAQRAGLHGHMKSHGTPVTSMKP